MARSAATAPLTYVEVEFRSTVDGKRVVVPRALVDTGSSDCELREAPMACHFNPFHDLIAHIGHVSRCMCRSRHLSRQGLFRQIAPLRSVREGVVYETVTGAEAYDVYEASRGGCGGAVARWRSPFWGAAA